MKSVQYDNSTPIAAILYSQFIKYDALFRIIQHEFQNSNAGVVDIYIDLYQFILPIFRCLRIDTGFAISSVIINYCAHFRSFFRTRYGVETNIILIWSSNDSLNNIRYIPEYNTYYRNRMASNNKIYDTVTDNLQLLNLLVPYLPNIYIKFGTVEPAVIIKGLIDKKLFNMGRNPSIVISTSQYMYQLPVDQPNCIVIRSKKDKKDKSDVSYSYNMLTAMTAYILELKNTLVQGTDPRKMAMLMNLIGIPKRSVKSLCDFKVALEVLATIPPGFEHDPTELYKSYYNYFLEHKTSRSIISAEEFANRFMCIDLTMQYNMYKQSPEYASMEFLKDLYDVDTVKQINNTYFTKDPIDLERL